jgi:hypothetical protein
MLRLMRDNQSEDDRGVLRVAKMKRQPSGIEKIKILIFKLNGEA